MANWTDAHAELLNRYPRAIVHMRKQFIAKRFGLIFGAGLNKTFGLPNWSDLVSSVADDPAIQGGKILERFTDRESLPYKTELLFQHFRKQQIDSVKGEPNTLTFENATYGKWLRICATHLYKTAPPDFEKALESHPYLLKYLPIIQNSKMTVTYNFDDYIERAMAAKRENSDKSRGYEMVTNPWAQFRRPTGVIYHPNGIVPTQPMELPVDRFVFSESSFAKQFLGALAGEFSGLLNHLSKNTCLIIGSSLEDEMFRHLLVQSAQANPGNFHYHCHFIKDGERIDAVDELAIWRANFRVYNLITLFLNQSEIAALGELLNPNSVNDDELEDCGRVHKTQLKYTFYMTGPLGVGKSTTVNQLRNLTVLDEWMEQRPEILAKPWDSLSPEEKLQVDSWIINQFTLKNDNLRHEKIGIFIVDRPPMDPLAFAKPEERSTKAKNILMTVSKNEVWNIAEGAVILLTGPHEDLAARILITGRDGYTVDKLQRMEGDLRQIYQSKCLRVVATNGMSIQDVTRRVAEIIHFEKYEPCNLHQMLKTISESS